MASGRTRTGGRARSGGTSRVGRRWAPRSGALAAAFAGACLLGSARADAADRGWLLRIGVEGGGDTLVSAERLSSAEVRLRGGGLVHLELGRLHVFPGAGRPRWEGELTLGYKLDSIDATNGTLSFTRFTLGAAPFYRVTERVRLGAALTYHVSPTLDVDAPRVAGLGDFRRTADGAFGVALAADYLLGDIVDVGLRVTLIDYDFPRDGERAAASVSGDSAGLYVTLHF